MVAGCLVGKLCLGQKLLGKAEFKPSDHRNPNLLPSHDILPRPGRGSLLQSFSDSTSACCEVVSLPRPEAMPACALPDSSSRRPKILFTDQPESLHWGSVYHNQIKPQLLVFPKELSTEVSFYYRKEKDAKISLSAKFCKDLNRMCHVVWMSPGEVMWSSASFSFFWGMQHPMGR